MRTENLEVDVPGWESTSSDEVENREGGFHGSTLP